MAIALYICSAIAGNHSLDLHHNMKEENILYPAIDRVAPPYTFFRVHELPLAMNTPIVFCLI
jgi:hypothetical protein